MNIEGTYTLSATPQQIWHALMDLYTLQCTLPGIEQIERIDQETYALTLTLTHAPLKGTYQGRVTISEQQYPYHYRLSVEGEGGPGSINGAGSIHLNERGNSTIIAYKGSLTIGKPGAMLPSATMVKGAAKLLIQQFFTALAEQPTLEAAKSTLGTHVALLPTTSTTTNDELLIQSGVYAKIVRFLKLGTNDPEQMARWTRRLRTASIISGLLFLVWLGTRLPGRQKE